MPKLPAHALMWSAENHGYILRTPDHLPQPIQSSDEDAWQDWLRTHSSFSFQGRHGHLNIYKEQRARGTGYWYAYHMNAGRMKKRYLGRSAALTFAHLEEVAQALQVPADTTLQTSKALRSAQIDSVAASNGIQLENEHLLSTVMTRLSPPRLPTTLVVRERLLTALDLASSRPLTLISASAGWGKTTLLAAWAHRSPHQIAWFSLEPSENDPIRFWISLITALRTCLPALGEHTLALLHASAPLTTSLTALLNDVVARKAEAAPLMLILDDYHVIEEPAIHASLLFLLEHLPPFLHLVLASRVDPDLPLARLRVRGHLGEIRDTDLRFTQEETYRFLTQSMGLDLTETDSALLEAHTEGWIASLHLAALLLQKQADPSAGARTLSGSHRYLLEYMREEILTSLPQPLQDFLLQTSGLSRLNASLCDAVTGKNNSALMLEQVLRANLFLQALEGAQPWYRYHALWAQALQHEAQIRLGEEAVRGLYSRASQWYEQQRLLPEAIEAALAGDDFARAASLIERLVIPQSFRNAYHTLARWLRQLPEEILRTRPDLCVLSVLALTFTTDRRSPTTWEQVARLLPWAEQGFEAKGQRDRLGEALELHAELAFYQDDLTSMLTLGYQARPLLSEQSLLYASHTLLYGLEALLAGEMGVAFQRFLEGYRRAKHLGNYSALFAASLFLGEVCLEQGELRRAEHYYLQALTHLDEDHEMVSQQLLLEAGSIEPFFISWAYHCLAQLAYERNNLSDAQQHLSGALILRTKPENRIHVLTSGALIQARLLYACGETQQALDLFSRWEMRTHTPWSLRAIRACRARLQVTYGDISAVENWAQEQEQMVSFQVPEHEDEYPLLFRQEEALLQARLHIAHQRGDSALKALTPWKEKALAQGRKRSVLEMLLLEALAHVVCHRHSQAKTVLREALQLAQSENYQRLFLDEGPMMKTLLKTLLSELHDASLTFYIRTLLQAFAGEDGRQETGQPEEQLNHQESLSEQEQRVLRLLVAGQSNPEIARELVVSINTVKTHVQGLYRKLNVHSRAQASEVARRLSLL